MRRCQWTHHLIYKMSCWSLFTNTIIVLTHFFLHKSNGFAMPILSFFSFVRYPALNGQYCIQKKGPLPLKKKITKFSSISTWLCFSDSQSETWWFRLSLSIHKIRQLLISKWVTVLGSALFQLANLMADKETDSVAWWASWLGGDGFISQAVEDLHSSVF